MPLEGGFLLSVYAHIYIPFLTHLNIGVADRLMVAFHSQEFKAHNFTKKPDDGLFAIEKTMINNSFLSKVL
jgi:hypothetical protein